MTVAPEPSARGVLTRFRKKPRTGGGHAFPPDRAGDFSPRLPRRSPLAARLSSRCFREPVRIGDVASEVGVHPSSLARAFQRHYRCTPGEFVRRLRVDLAGQRLAQSEVSLAAIARETGFSDQSHFSRTFKSVTGMTPGDFRLLVTRN